VKILFCSADRFPPFRVDVDVLFARELQRRGYEIDWLLQSEEDCEKAYRTTWEGGEAWVGPADNGPTRFKRIKKHFQSLLHDTKMFRLGRRNSYDIIQVKDKFISALTGMCAARIFNSKFTYWLSYPFPEASIYEARTGVARYKWFYYWRGYLFKFLLYKVIMPGADHVFVQSEQMRSDVISEGIRPSKLTAVPMGISIEEFEYDRSAEGGITTSQERKVLYLGTMQAVRRIDFVLRVFEKVKAEISDVRLLMVGGSENPEDMVALRDEAELLKIQDSVTFTGNLPRGEAMSYVEQATLCISPFYPTPILNSTSPTKLIVYMAMGKAVVANDHPEQRAVIDNSGSGLCVAYNEEAFAEAIISLLNNPEMMRDMGLRGRKYVEQHRSYKKIAERVDNKYSQICGE
jgi:glycosyltransferase involved in cell wall biosynthesis